jgi:hypothetical protein
MPIEARADVAQRVIFVRLHGSVGAEEFFRHQEETVARPDYAGFHELVEVEPTAKLDYRSEHEVRALAALSAKSDLPDRTTRLAIVAPNDLHFGLGRMYESFRTMAPGSGREVQVFRSRAEALSWVGVKEPGP